MILTSMEMMIIYSEILVKITSSASVIEYPLILYALDFEMDGILDPFMTAFWKDQNGKMKEYPVNYLDELIEQSSFFQNKIQRLYLIQQYRTIDNIWMRT